MRTGYSAFGYDFNVSCADLNAARIATEGGPRALVDHGTALTGDVSVHFRNLAPALVAFIRGADAIVGCCAWLTEPTVLNALAGRAQVSLIVNKEDFLRPDYSASSYDRDLRQQYDRLPGINRYDHGPAHNLSYASSPDTAAVRCVGVTNGSRSNRPRLHHKFMVALRGPFEHPDGPAHEPYAVWTGSFNPTRGGTRSLENAVTISVPAVAECFYREWGQALALSEPLNWEQPYVCPEYRIGT